MNKNILEIANAIIENINERALKLLLYIFKYMSADAIKKNAIIATNKE